MYFSVGQVSAQAELGSNADIKIGDSMRLYAPRSEVMVLPIGGVEALRKVPGHPLFAEGKQPSAACAA